ncbi:PIN/TRAM domain-containing protein [Candidatus Formimonas warabiya]|uniref:Twitching motility protein PilT n=1 Tax=Formimonas warabiya TaxID=1761012 RepID=A0A3G1KXD3_FORW1|nr:PIN/TRAM domain-containing protein [Candidatus Formimonas warabiya]ATW27080.1 twitching motility protein PilT [Candidatus Formimonas warabiya]
MLRKFIQAFIGIATAVGGFFLSRFLIDYFLVSPSDEIRWSTISFSVVLSLLIGLSIAPKIMVGVQRFTNWFLTQLFKIPVQDIAGGAVGLIIGLFIANQFGSSVARIKYVGPYLSLTGSLFLGYVGLSVGVKKRDELLSFLTNVMRFSGKDKEKASKTETKKIIPGKILDTSVIIDGRISDIYKTGFVEGTLVIPNFVLEELRHIADSSDLLKRNRGRRGLDILNKLRQEFDLMIEIVDKDYEDITEVDSKLVRLAQETNGYIITNDYNLNKVAQLQGVVVLNINELANAVKPVVLPGEEMIVRVIKDGKEMGQGIGYLDDGTMIVVENGKKYMGQTIGVVVTSVLQTAAGRMIFGRPKQLDKKMGMIHELDSRGEYQCLT